MAERSDAAVLEDLLSREHRLLSAYEAALRREAIGESLGEALLAHERDHVDALERTLAGLGSRNPRATVPAPELTAALAGRRSFALYAIRLEDETVRAYAEGVPRLGDERLRRPLGSIMVCGGAHVVALKDSLRMALVD
jgi:Ferritin-like domain